MLDNYLRKAKKFSKFYPPVQFPPNEKDWNIGHDYLKSFEKERKKIYIPSMISCLYRDKLLQLFAEEKSVKSVLTLMLLLSFFQTTKKISDENKDKMSSSKKISFLLKLKLNDAVVFAQRLGGAYWLLGKRIQVKIKKCFLRYFFNGNAKAWHDLIKSREDWVPLKQLVFSKRLANCGELSNLAKRFFVQNKITCYRVQLLFDYQNYESDVDHSFLLFRADNKKMSYKEMLSDLYHPSVRILDPWYGKCAHPKEMFNEYIQYFQDQRHGCFFRFKKGTALVVKEDEEPNKYIVGRVDSDEVIQVANHRPQLKFSAVCVPHLYKKRRLHVREKE